MTEREKEEAKIIIEYINEEKEKAIKAKEKMDMKTVNLKAQKVKALTDILEVITGDENEG